MYSPLAKSEMNHQPKNGQQPQSHTPANRPDPQVLTRPTRRRFSAAYKRRILKEAAACTRHGELGELLRREGLYSSTLARFRQQQQTGCLDRPKEPRQKAARQQHEAVRQRDARRIARLQAENQQLRTLIELQKKLCELMGGPLLGPPSE